MKKIIAVLVMMTAFLFFSVNVSAKEVKNICVFGDSIPAGYGLENPSENFVNMLGAEYGDVKNFAVVGSESGQILERIENTDRDILKNADTVIISAGGNDIMNVYGLKLLESAEKYRAEMESMRIVLNYSEPVNIIGQITALLFYPEKADMILKIFDECMTESAKADYKKAVSDFGENMREMVRHIKSTGSQADIYFFALYNPISVFSAETDFFNSLDESIEAMREDVLLLAEGDGKFHAVDVFGHFRGHYAEWTNIYKFDIHPNKAGHQQLYELTEKALEADEKEEIESSLDIYDVSHETEIPESNDYIVWLILGGIVAVAVTGAVIIAVAKNSE